MGWDGMACTETRRDKNTSVYGHLSFSLTEAQRLPVKLLTLWAQDPLRAADTPSIANTILIGMVASAIDLVLEVSRRGSEGVTRNPIRF